MGQQGRAGRHDAGPDQFRDRPTLPRTPEHFDRRWALAKAADIIEDIGTVDERLGEGIRVDGALSLLSDSYGRLVDAGVPPGLDRRTYRARITALQWCAGVAASTYDLDPMDATSQYLVVREETGVLFGQVNGAIGSHLALPEAPWAGT